MDRKQYVVGLAFDSSREQVALVLKQTGPACVIGNWNGVGGKIEEGESPLEAMVREFYEETGADLPENEWEQFAVLHANDYDLFFMVAATDRTLAAHTVEKEEVKLWKCSEAISLPNLMHNMRWMIPFLQDPEIEHDLGNLRVHR